MAAWLRLETRLDPAAPSKRECHTIVTAGERLVLFGGNDDQGRFREVHVLDTVSLRWTRVEATDAAPGKRSAHSAVMAADGRWMYVFGGWNGTEELGDVTRFDVDALEWERVATRGTPPAPRHFQMSARVGDRMCVCAARRGGAAWSARAAARARARACSRPPPAPPTPRAGSSLAATTAWCGAATLSR